MLRLPMKVRFAISVWACSSSFPFPLLILTENACNTHFFSLASPVYGHLTLFGFGYIYGFCTKENSPNRRVFFSSPFLFPLYAANINWQSRAFYTIQASVARILKFQSLLTVEYTSLLSKYAPQVPPPFFICI